MPASEMHSLLTRRAIESLPGSVRDALANEAEALCSDYCLYPDRFHSDPDTIAPYLCFVDGTPFHYIPNEPVEYNNWTLETVNGQPKLRALPLPENVHHRHCATAFPWYFKQIARALAERSHQDAARFAGALLHVLQDQTTPPHLLEGFDGTDIFLFDRYFRPTANQLPPSMILGEKICFPGPQQYQLRLLGTSAEEAAFRLYTCFAETVRANRLHVLPLLNAAYGGDAQETNVHGREMAGNAIQLTADVLYTAISIGTAQWLPEDLQPLQRVALETLHPVRRPHLLSPPYRFTPFIADACLDRQRQRVPLSLRFDDGERRQYRHGLGMGAHVEFAFEHLLPSGIFDRLQGAAGLHPELGKGGHAKLQWLLDGRVLWEDEFDAKHLAGRFDLEVRQGGRLALRGQALTMHWASPDNNLVLAEPVLLRSSTAP